MNTKLMKTCRTLLFLSGTLLIMIGTLIIFSPVDFYAANNIELGADVSLLNELKAPAGLLLVAGLFMIFAMVRGQQADMALGLASLIYLSYAVSRSLSMSFDGMPAAGLVQATALEGVLGLACLVILMLRRTQPRRAV